MNRYSFFAGCKAAPTSEGSEALDDAAADAGEGLELADRSTLATEGGEDGEAVGRGQVEELSLVAGTAQSGDRQPHLTIRWLRSGLRTHLQAVRAGWSIRLYSITKITTCAETREGTLGALILVKTAIDIVGC